MYPNYKKKKTLRTQDQEKKQLIEKTGKIWTDLSNEDVFMYVC